MYGMSPDNDDTDGMSAKEIVARTIFGEASNQEYIGQQAVANVISNRVRLQGWMGKTFKDVCLKPYQFSCWLPGSDRDRLMAVKPSDLVYAQCFKIAGLAISNNLPDVTKGASSYCTIDSDPNWEKTMIPTVTIGFHKFFRLA